MRRTVRVLAESWRAPGAGSTGASKIRQRPPSTQDPRVRNLYSWPRPSLSQGRLSDVVEISSGRRWASMASASEKTHESRRQQVILDRTRYLSLPLTAESMEEGTDEQPPVELLGNGMRFEEQYSYSEMWSSYPDRDILRQQMEQEDSNISSRGEQQRLLGSFQEEATEEEKRAQEEFEQKELDDATKTTTEKNEKGEEKVTGKGRTFIAALKQAHAAAELKKMQQEMQRWYDPLVRAIHKEQAEVWMESENTRKPGEKPKKDMRLFGPILIILSPEKLATIILTNAINQIAAQGGGEVLVVNFCVKIADDVQSEVNLLDAKKEDLVGALKDHHQSRHVRKITKKSRQAMQMVALSDWPVGMKVKLGACLVRLLCESCREPSDGEKEGEPTFVHEVKSVSPSKRMGSLKLSQAAETRLKHTIDHLVAPRLKPMLVPPVKWSRHDKGGYFKLQCRLMRTRGSRSQIDALRAAKLDQVYKCLDFLGSIPWRIDDFIYDIANEAWLCKMKICDYPSQEDIPEGERKTRPLIVKLAVKNENAKRVEEGKPELTAEEEAEMKVKYDIEAAEYHKWRKIVQHNRDLKSLRGDVKIKLNLAEEFKGKKMYFPHNLDFRGRAYPVPPNLNHMGNDLCRGLLRFSEGRPLTEKGVWWLKVQVASLFGKDKLSFDDRVDYAMEHLDQIRESVRDPLGENAWWQKADQPWQCLAACRDLVHALDSGDPASYISHHPIHQDGSCNGLQHYAALGRDEIGGAQVNLLPGDKPNDVYMRVCNIVQEKIAELANKPVTEKLSQKEKDHIRYGIILNEKIKVGRKVVKQTVMTSVYGVTFVGARKQIQRQLESQYVEQLEAEGKKHVILTTEESRDIYNCAHLVATLTMAALESLFKEARGIMDWLATLARDVAKEREAMGWVTPLGLPVIQPYRREKGYVVQTQLQAMSLTDSSDVRPISTSRQKSACPPNFVHSLDSTHMFYTALEMQRRNIPFAAVHDSFWAHACNIDEMNEVLRDQFVKLYTERDVLEELRDSLSLRFPETEFEPLPGRGSLDIEKVKKSPYFFN